MAALIEFRIRGLKAQLGLAHKANILLLSSCDSGCLDCHIVTMIFGLLHRLDEACKDLALLASFSDTICSLCSPCGILDISNELLTQIFYECAGSEHPMEIGLYGTMHGPFRNLKPVCRTF